MDYETRLKELRLAREEAYNILMDFGPTWELSPKDLQAMEEATTRYEIAREAYKKFLEITSPE